MKYTEQNGVTHVKQTSASQRETLWLKKEMAQVMLGRAECSRCLHV